MSSDNIVDLGGLFNKKLNSYKELSIKWLDHWLMIMKMYGLKVQRKLMRRTSFIFVITILLVGI
jgi:hypothetical protein